MRRLLVLHAALVAVTTAQAVAAAAAPYGVVRQEEEAPLPTPTPLDDPYAPPAGDPDPFATGPSEDPSPLNPAGD